MRTIQYEITSNGYVLEYDGLKYVAENKQKLKELISMLVEA